VLRLAGADHQPHEIVAGDITRHDIAHLLAAAHDDDPVGAAKISCILWLMMITGTRWL
jgi:hypothetical protein